METEAENQQKRRLPRSFIYFVGFCVLVNLAFFSYFKYIEQHFIYESSDRGMAVYENRFYPHANYLRALADFAIYKEWRGDNALFLCRTFARNWFNPFNWWQNLTHSRYELPYKKRSSSPQLCWKTKVPARYFPDFHSRRLPEECVRRPKNQ